MFLVVHEDRYPGLTVRSGRETDEDVGQSFGDGAREVSGHDVRPSDAELVSITALHQFNVEGVLTSKGGRGWGL